VDVENDLCGLVRPAGEWEGKHLGGRWMKGLAGGKLDLVDLGGRGTIPGEWGTWWLKTGRKTGWWNLVEKLWLGKKGNPGGNPLVEEVDGWIWRKTVLGTTNPWLETWIRLVDLLVGSPGETGWDGGGGIGNPRSHLPGGTRFRDLGGPGGNLPTWWPGWNGNGKKKREGKERKTGRSEEKRWKK